VYRLELTTSNNPEVGAFANVLIVCQDVLERLMRLVLLAVIGSNLLCAISRADDIVAARAASIMAKCQAAKCCVACLNICPALHAYKLTGLNQHFSLDCYTPQGLTMTISAVDASEQF